MRSNYPQNAVKGKLLMHSQLTIARGVLLISLALKNMKGDQAFLKQAIPWFVGVGV